MKLCSNKILEVFSASITKGGNLYINDKTLKKFNVENLNFIQIYYNKESSKLGMFFTGNPNAIEVIKAIKGEYGKNFRINNILKNERIDNKETMSFEITEDTSTIPGKKLLVLDLNKGESKKQ